MHSWVSVQMQTSKNYSTPSVSVYLLSEGNNTDVSQLGHNPSHLVKKHPGPSSIIRGWDGAQDVTSAKPQEKAPESGATPARSPVRPRSRSILSWRFHHLLTQLLQRVHVSKTSGPYPLKLRCPLLVALRASGHHTLPSPSDRYSNSYCLLEDF